MPNPEIDFILVCDFAETDSQKKLNIRGVFNIIDSPGFPALHPSFFVVARIKGLEVGRTYEENVRIVYSGAEVAKSDPKPFRPEVEPLHQFVHNVKDLLLPAGGEYRVEIYLDNRLLGYTTFRAKQL